jgi:hypothetical protein
MMGWLNEVIGEMERWRGTWSVVGFDVGKMPALLEVLGGGLVDIFYCRAAYFWLNRGDE